MADEYAVQKRLLDALARGDAFNVAEQAVQRIDTHISCIYLAGELAFKIKKAVDLGFVDFTGLEQRREACEEELRLNARMAPGVYRRVARICGEPERPVVDGDGPVLDYAVVMARFPQQALLSRMLEDNRLTAAHIAELAERLAAFHGSIPAASADRGFGTPEAVERRVMENFEALPELLEEGDDQLQRLKTWTQARLSTLAEVIGQRLETGNVRECHGDLHLDNMIYWQERIMAFDGIEFNADLRWIDTANELAFVTMDLDDRGAPEFARQLRNAYLEHTGDYAALSMLVFYQVYRALVRAKIHAIQARQQETDEAAQAARRNAMDYMDLAESYTAPARPCLVLMHGVSGTGKSTLAEELVGQRGHIRLRSDVERKRLFGLGPHERSDKAGKAIYTAEASRKTYQRLRELAEQCLRAGYSPVVDATFLRAAHREPFIELAESLDMDWTIVALRGSRETLHSRVAARTQAGADVSEADTAVLESQLEELEPLSSGEAQRAVELDIEAIPADWYRQVPG